MSVNRENVIWQSKDGTWSRGFFDFFTVNSDSPDWDFEWDVEYTGEFMWVSTGHASEEAAQESWKGANPGGSTTVAYTPQTREECDRYDDLAEALRSEEAKQR